MKKKGYFIYIIQINPQHLFLNVLFTKLPDTGIKIKKGYDSLNKIEKVPSTKPFTLYAKLQGEFG